MSRRIRDRATFSALAEAPKLRADPLALRYLPGPELQVAYAVSRRVGGAVARNHLRRRLRAAVEDAELPPGAYLVSADERARRASFSALVGALEQLGRRVTGA